MSSKVTIDSAGRIVIPKAIRESLGLLPGDSLEITATTDEITLRPIRDTATLTNEQGIWVHRTGIKITNDDVSDLIDRIRQDRIFRNMRRRHT